MVAVRVVVCFAVLAAAVATNVQQCSDKSYENLNENVQLSPCKKTPCRLRKGTSQAIKISFTPDKDMAVIKNSVKALILGLPVPFIGVDGLSVCDKIYSEDGDKAPCPLKAGTKYIYEDSFPVLELYPTLDTKVRWALEDKNEHPIICFEVPVRIVK